MENNQPRKWMSPGLDIASVVGGFLEEATRDSLSPLPASEASPERGGVWSGVSVGDGDLFNMMLASLSPEDALCAWPQDFFTHVSNPSPG